MNKDDINNLYEEKAIGVYPFINKNRITILEKGYYTKKKAAYRGISYVYDEQSEKYKSLLLGYYYVPEDYIIVPTDLEMTEGKVNLVDTYLKKGFTNVSECPSFKPVSFDENSEEYQVAKESYETYKTT